MPIHDYLIENQTLPDVRTDLNNALSAIVSNNSSAVEPTTTFAYMWWADTTNDLLKQRNEANTDWVDIFPLSTGPISTYSIVEIYTSATPSDTIDIPVGNQADFDSYGIMSTDYAQYYELPKFILQNINTYQVDARGIMMGSSGTSANQFTFINTATFNAGVLTQLTCDTGGNIYSVFGINY